jgi:hypothetical protein
MTQGSFSGTESILDANYNTERAKCPVFVMGCHRSGTNLLYDTLLSAGGFAVYSGYLPIHKILIPRVGPLGKLRNRKKAMDIWLRSKGFRRSGLDAGRLTKRVLAECRNGGDFIRITMDEIAQNQGVSRWAVYDPAAVLDVPDIKADIPEALFIHIIRDGRDIALSLNKMGGFKPFPWAGKSRDLMATALYWEWMVSKGRFHGQQIPADYIEVHYEELVSHPQTTLATLSKFLDHDLDYERIQRTGLGRLRESNSSFREDPKGAQQNPVDRWKSRLSAEEISALEALVGDCLEQFGYSLTAPKRDRNLHARHRIMRNFYPAFLDAKVWLRTRTPVGRFANLSALELSS